jgi:hypothetical protein
MSAVKAFRWNEGGDEEGNEKGACDEKHGD